jgi:hypothetical protein
MFRRSSLTFLGLVLLLSMLSGCTGKPPAAEIEGKVTYQGKPVRGARITFQAAVYNPQLNSAYTVVDQDGTYSLRGIPIGAVQVAIDPEYTRTDLIPSWPGPPETVPYVYIPVPSKYHSLKTSGLVLNVKPGKQSQDFKLEE